MITPQERYQIVPVSSGEEGDLGKMGEVNISLGHRIEPDDMVALYTHVLVLMIENHKKKKNKNLDMKIYVTRISGP